MPRFGKLFLGGAMLLLFVVTPLFSVQAQGPQFPGDLTKPGLVPCGDPDDPQCNVCHLGELSQDLLTLAIYIAVFLATILIAYAGFKMITAQGDMNAIKEAKGIFLKAILGLVFVLAAWLIVSTLMSVFFNSRLDAWNNFGDCKDQPNYPTPAGAPSQQGTGEITAVDPSQSGTLTRLTATDAQQRFQSLNINVKSGIATEGVSREVIEALSVVQGATSQSLTVTSATGGTHSNPCHRSGSCLDVVCTSCGNSVEDLNKFITTAFSKGYCAVYEPGGSCPAGIAKCLPNVGTGPHFSFYMTSSQSPSCR